MQSSIEPRLGEQPITVRSDPTSVKVEKQLITLQDVMPSPGTLLHTKAQLTAEIARLRGRLAESITQTESATAHAQLMARQNQELQKTMNAKSKKQNGRKKHTTDARLVTSDEYVMLRRKEMEEEEAEAKRIAEKAHQREFELESRQRGRIETAHAVVWNAGWRNRKKEDLKDLCYALGLSTDGTRSGMIERVETHLAAHPQLTSDLRFQALYSLKVTDK
ncbi:hypothetical protein FS749_005545 [Ceratobasidium sp. UAMH 11750]|nr:hypothetical protein FS749_005545 [Ceratobasidium sp. UAMH 11750]